MQSIKIFALFLLFTKCQFLPIANETHILTHKTSSETIHSRFNNTTSPNIQTYLAGIYRKTQVPDAFGPLVKMLIQNSLRPQTSNFDPNEEIGGAILSYISDRFRNQPQK